jgi:hypothetical protein
LLIHVQATAVGTFVARSISRWVDYYPVSEAYAIFDDKSGFGEVEMKVFVLVVLIICLAGPSIAQEQWITIAVSTLHGRLNPD